MSGIRAGRFARVVVPIGLVVAVQLGAALATALMPASVHGGEGCTFVAAVGIGPVDPPPDVTGSSSLTVDLDEEITFWGTFIPNAQIDLDFFHDGVPFGDYTPGTADANGYFLFVHEFNSLQDQQGVWRVVASVADTECAGEVTVTVLGPASATPLPNTAVAEGSAGPGGLVGALVVLAAGLVALGSRGWRAILGGAVGASPHTGEGSRPAL